MDKEFPLEYTYRKGIVFDVSAVRDRDIDIYDIDKAKVEEEQFVAFYTGYKVREFPEMLIPVIHLRLLLQQW